MDPLKISLITPTYNQAAFLPEMLASIEQQQDPHLEHIILDALSTDGTEQILADYARRTGARVIREADRGQSHAINKGMQLASGHIAGWLNSDDLLCPKALTMIRSAFQIHPHAVVVYGRGSKIDRYGKHLKTVPYRAFDPIALQTAYLVVQPAMYFRLNAFHQVGGLDESLEYAMDWELLIRLAQCGEVTAIPQEIARIRYYADTKTAQGGWKRMREIADIGRHYHGWRDLNFLSYTLRNIISKVPTAFPRWAVDQIFWRMSKKRPVMVQGWPSR